MSLWTEFLDYKGRRAWKWTQYFPAYERHLAREGPAGRRVCAGRIRRHRAMAAASTPGSWGTRTFSRERVSRPAGFQSSPGQSPSQQPSFRRQRGHCHVACRHSIRAPQRGQSSTTVCVTRGTLGRAAAVFAGTAILPRSPFLARHQLVCSSAIARASSRIAMPSSTSSRVIVSGGQTMITFQCVIR